MNQTATIAVSRPSRWQNKFRPYQVLLDGTAIGTVRNGQDAQFPVPPGHHRIQLRIDWCTSPELPVSLIPGERAGFECAPDAKPPLVIWRVLFRSEKYLSLRPITSA
jgi:hypothetical protein